MQKRRAANLETGAGEPAGRQNPRAEPSGGCFTAFLHMVGTARDSFAAPSGLGGFLPKKLVRFFNILRAYVVTLQVVATFSQKLFKSALMGPIFILKTVVQDNNQPKKSKL